MKCRQHYMWRSTGNVSVKKKKKADKLELFQGTTRCLAPPHGVDEYASVTCKWCAVLQQGRWVSPEWHFSVQWRRLQNCAWIAVHFQLEMKSPFFLVSREGALLMRLRCRGDRKTLIRKSSFTLITTIFVTPSVSCVRYWAAEDITVL